MSSSNRNTNDDIFDHEFEGWSVWLESDSTAVTEEAEILRELCGGPAVGCDTFVPHCTMLYNFPKQRKQAEEKHTTNNELKEDDMERTLESIRDEFLSRIDEATTMATAPSPPPSFQLDPTDFYFFHYPKSADGGRGFGCVISMLLLDKPAWLTTLHECCRKAFPEDERKSGNFIPHMSLVYAPENQMEQLQQYTEEHLKTKRKDLLEPMNVRWLSLWSTEGKLKDWRRIAKVDFP